MTNTRQQSRRNGKKGATAVVLFGVVAGMVGLAFASVPLYELFCRVTGYGGTPQLEVADGDVETLANARTIKIRFDSNVNGKLPWKFRPVQREIETQVGAQVLAFYEARNVSEKAVTGTSTFNVTPFKAGPYFNKTDCFCFTEQLLEPGQEVAMPVSFFVDPAIFDDPNTAEVTTITLSYTFFPVKPDAESTTQTSGLVKADSGS